MREDSGKGWSENEERTYVKLQPAFEMKTLHCTLFE